MPHPVEPQANAGDVQKSSSDEEDGGEPGAADVYVERVRSVREPLTEGRKEELVDLVNEFEAGEETRIELPRTLSATERQFVDKAARDLGLETHPSKDSATGKPYLTLFKVIAAGAHGATAGTDGNESFAPDSPQSQAAPTRGLRLPRGWEKKESAKYFGKSYYVHEVLQLTSWDPPTGTIFPEEGSVEENESEEPCSARPSAPSAAAESEVESAEPAPVPQPQRLPPGWEVRESTKHGRPYYVNESTGQTLWEMPEYDETPPRRLPDGWAMQMSQAHGRPYYTNESSGVTQWEFPEESSPTVEYYEEVGVDQLVAQETVVRYCDTDHDSEELQVGDCVVLQRRQDNIPEGELGTVKGILKEIWEGDKFGLFHEVLFGTETCQVERVNLRKDLKSVAAALNSKTYDQYRNERAAMEDYMLTFGNAYAKADTAVMCPACLRKAGVDVSFSVQCPGGICTMCGNMAKALYTRSEAQRRYAQQLKPPSGLPNGLPAGWSEAFDSESGQPFYINDQTGHRQWEFPAQAKAPPRPKRVPKDVYS